jgi:hypothetical protein
MNLKFWSLLSTQTTIHILRTLISIILTVSHYEQEGSVAMLKDRLLRKKFVSKKGLDNT